MISLNNDDYSNNELFNTLNKHSTILDNVMLP